jgi:hypothetical protein
MEILRLTFQLGVFFAIYGFIWFFIDLGIKLLTVGNPRSVFEAYIFKAIKYVFLVNVIFLFSIDMNSGNISIVNLYPIIFIMILYFIGKFQKNQKNNLIMSSMGMGMIQSKFNPKYEIFVIVVALLAFVLFVFNPESANNPVAFWFKESILDIESTAIIGFVFKIIGFFFLVGILLKTINAFQLIVSGKLFAQNNANRDSSDFDDYEEVN